jgi:hypothetical protein
MPFFLNDKAVEPDEEGCFGANCSVCFLDKQCHSITYPKIQEICTSFEITPHSFAVCKDCFKNVDKRSLQTNIMDYFVMDELYRWTMGKKDGIVRSDLEYHTLIQVATEQGILYREEKRTRHRYTREERVLHLGFVNMLKRENTTDYTPNALYQNLFKKLYEG